MCNDIFSLRLCTLVTATGPACAFMPSRERGFINNCWRISPFLKYYYYKTVVLFRAHSALQFTVRNLKTLQLSTGVFQWKRKENHQSSVLIVKRLLISVQKHEHTSNSLSIISLISIHGFLYVFSCRADLNGTLLLEINGDLCNQKMFIWLFLQKRKNSSQVELYTPLYTNSPDICRTIFDNFSTTLFLALVLAV